MPISRDGLSHIPITATSLLDFVFSETRGEKDEEEKHLGDTSIRTYEVAVSNNNHDEHIQGKKKSKNIVLVLCTERMVRQGASSTFFFLLLNTHRSRL